MEDPTESFEFIHEIMEDEGLPDDTKDEFYEKFGSKYIENRNFRHKYHGGYIVFVRDKFYGTFPTEEDIDTNDNSQYIFYIGDRIDCHIRKNHFVECPDSGTNRNLNN